MSHRARRARPVCERATRGLPCARWSAARPVGLSQRTCFWHSRDRRTDCGGRQPPRASRPFPLARARTGSSAIRTRSSRGLPSTPPPFANGCRPAAIRHDRRNLAAGGNRWAAEQLRRTSQRRGWGISFLEIVQAGTFARRRSPRGQRVRAAALWFAASRASGQCGRSQGSGAAISCSRFWLLRPRVRPVHATRHYATYGRAEQDATPRPLAGFRARRRARRVAADCLPTGPVEGGDVRRHVGCCSRRAAQDPECRPHRVLPGIAPGLRAKFVVAAARFSARSARGVVLEPSVVRVRLRTRRSLRALSAPACDGESPATRQFNDTSSPGCQTPRPSRLRASRRVHTPPPETPGSHPVRPSQSRCCPRCCRSRSRVAEAAFTPYWQLTGWNFVANVGNLRDTDSRTNCSSCAKGRPPRACGRPHGRGVQKEFTGSGRRRPHTSFRTSMPIRRRKIILCGLPLPEAPSR